MPTIRLFGGLRREAGRSAVTADGKTVRAALDALCADHSNLREAIFEGNKLRPHVRVMVNGRDIELGQGLDMPLASEDEMAIFPPIGGGVK